MHLSTFNYHLPKELIAQHPQKKRGMSRLLVLDRSKKTFIDSSFLKFPDLLREGDVLVVNNSKVFPARLFGKLENSSREVEIFLLKEIAPRVWETLVRPGKHIRAGARILFPSSAKFATGGKNILQAEVIQDQKTGRRVLRFHCKGNFHRIIDQIGVTPLPPYIHREMLRYSKKDAERYQTIYARERGSIAAPTAGLHFSSNILKKIRSKGVEIVQITLHVGYATFQTIHVEDIAKHKMESEHFSVSQESASTIQKALQENRRVIAVGTTTCRVLETITTKKKEVVSGEGETNLFIFPGYCFKAVSALLTNFHLPQSSLLMLVCAFGGQKFILDAYRHAAEEQYQFYSFGDAMMII